MASALSDKLSRLVKQMRGQARITEDNVQEMLREANTTGSKANDATMLQDVVTIKEELERIREQVENLE